MPSNTRTDTCGLGLVDRPPGIARLAVFRTVHRAIRPGLADAIVACTDITYSMHKPIIVGACVRDKHLRMHAVLAWFIVHPVLHDTHFAAPFTTQSTPAFGTPCGHVHKLPTKDMSTERMQATKQVHGRPTYARVRAGM